MPAEALRWAEAALGPGARVVEAEPLVGATSSRVYGLRAQGARHAIDTAEFVLRLHDNADWLAAEPDLPRHEAAALTFAASAGLPAPRLVAVDNDGSASGLPAVLMTRLPGRVRLEAQPELLEQLARALAAIHRVPPADFPWRYFPFVDAASFGAQTWSSRPAVWARAAREVEAWEPDEEEVFLHRDFHPANVLWSTNQVSGVVDWVNACRGWAGVDIGHCRWNLAALHGLPAADGFLDAYLAEVAGYRYDRRWDLAAALDLGPGAPGVYPGWPAFGATRITAAEVNARTDEFVQRALASVNAEG